MSNDQTETHSAHTHKVKLTIATVEALSYRGEVERVSLPTVTGRISVRPGHQTLIGLLAPGIVVVSESDGSEQEFLVTGGFFEVRTGSDVAVMADSIDAKDSLDLEEIRKAKERAEKVLEERSRMSTHEFAHAEEMLARELARLSLAERYGKR